MPSFGARERSSDDETTEAIARIQVWSPILCVHVSFCVQSNENEIFFCVQAMLQSNSDQQKLDSDWVIEEYDVRFCLFIYSNCEREKIA